ncbi:zinc-ribbon domain-containing protein [Acetobacterium sp.]|uniref:zinc-ribbon domain-containing protein n=1 Tax=Acetobacterium sp. TaxID=1872094 RepID=UPI002F423C8F
MLSEWDTALNGDLSPNLVSKSSSLIVWWNCAKGHSWAATIISRTRGGKCPYCSGRWAIKGVNDLKTKYPKLVSAWDYERNVNVLPENILPYSHLKVHWVCNEKHHWEARIYDRVRGRGCPYCAHIRPVVGVNDLKTLYPNLIEEWDYYKNNELKPEDLLPQSNMVVWWRCNKEHQWKAPISRRTKGTGCPYCEGVKVLSGFNDLKTLYPDLAAEWDYKKNGELLPNDVLPGSHKIIWWCCKEAHRWDAAIYHRTIDKNGCPYCSGRKAIKGETDLITTRPDLVKEWFYEKNEKGPENFKAFSHEIVYWKCLAEGHVWQQSIDKRTAGSGCPYCTGKKVVPGNNDFLTEHPKIAEEWHPEKNGDVRSDMVSSHSGKKVWWRCKYGHEWKTTVRHRVRGTKCPLCKNKQKGH